MDDELLRSAAYCQGYEDAEKRWRKIADELRAELRQQNQQILRYMECQTAIFRALAGSLAPRDEP